MQPTTLSAVREESLPVDIFLMEEARKKHLRADGARMVFAEDRVQIYKEPEGFVSSSMIYHQSTAECHESYWENHVSEISAGTAIRHLAGFQIPNATAENLNCAEETIGILDHFEIGIDDLTFVACSSKATEQMLNYFKPSSFAVEDCDFNRGDGKIVEEVVIDHIYRDLQEIRIVANEYPARIVEAFLKCFQKSETGLHRLMIQFPESKLPRDPFIGMDCRLLNNFQKSFALLIRSDSVGPRHVLLRGELDDGFFVLDFCRVTDCDDLLFKMFGALYEVFPDEPILGISPHSPSELREFFEAHW